MLAAIVLAVKCVRGSQGMFPHPIALLGPGAHTFGRSFKDDSTDLTVVGFAFAPTEGLYSGHRFK